MSATPITVAATLRGKDDVLKVRDLLDRLAEVESDMAAAEEYLDVLRRRRDDVLRLLDVLKVRDLLDRLAEVESDMAAAEEYLDVLSRRRDDVLRLLENKGIRVAPDPIEIATANGEPA